MGREYRFFCAYLSLSVLRSIALVIASRAGTGFGRNLYGYTWAFTEPVLIAALIAFTIECYGLVYQHYPGVDDPKKPILNRILLVGGAVCLISLLPDLWRSHWQPTLTLFFAIERAVTTLGAMLMALVLGAYLFMPVLMPPNIMRHVRITLTYLTVNMLAYFGVNVLWGSKQTWSLLLMGAGTLCFFLWTAMLTRQGQIEPEPDLSYEEDPELELSWEELREISQQAPRLRFRWFGWFRSKN